tara:strand:- start:1253 stop:1447 length:195 start_codon:yes stop_codon:yes gene_type:complete
MDINDMDIYKINLMQKLSLLLFINSSDINDLEKARKLILKCKDYTKIDIINLLETEEYNYGFKK